MTEIFPLSEAVGPIVVAALLTLLSFWVARRGGFFRLPPKPTTHPVTLRQTLGGFGIYLLVALFTFPMIALVSRTFAPEYTPERRDGWVIVAQVIICSSLIGYCFLIRPAARREIFWGSQPGTSRRFWKSFGLGALTWLISYPFVLLTNTLTALFQTLVWGKVEVEQIAVTELKASMDKPVIFILLLLVVSLLVPFVEELLFRGFLQSYLRKYLGRGWAMVSAAAIFAVVHYAPRQGVGNLQLILSLFILSLFLSFLYERERTIWAPIGLHASFNALSALWISIS